MTATTARRIDHAATISPPRLRGRTLTRLMRRHHVTIRELARRIGISQAIVRRSRAVGLAYPAAVDWQQAIVGEYTPRLRAQFRQWRRQWLDGE